MTSAKEPFQCGGTAWYRSCHEPPEVAWALPEPVAGAELELKPPDPRGFGEGLADELEPRPEADEPGLDEVELEPDERAPGLGAAGRPAGAGAAVLWAGPGRVTARAPAATTLATMTVVVIELAVAWARSLAATAR